MSGWSCAFFQGSICCCCRSPRSTVHLDLGWRWLQLCIDTQRHTIRKLKQEFRITVMNVAKHCQGHNLKGKIGLHFDVTEWWFFAIGGPCCCDLHRLLGVTGALELSRLQRAHTVKGDSFHAKYTVLQNPPSSIQCVVECQRNFAVMYCFQSMAVTGEPDREPANRDRTVAPPHSFTVDGFTVEHGLRKFTGAPSPMYRSTCSKFRKLGGHATRTQKRWDDIGLETHKRQRGARTVMEW